MRNSETGTDEVREPELPAELRPDELEAGYSLRGESRLVDLTDSRWLVLELGGPENRVVVGRKKPGDPDAIGGPVHDARDGVPFVYIGAPGSGESERTIEIPSTHPLLLGRNLQKERFSKTASRIHAMLRRQGNKVVIEDLGSTHGTTVHYQG